MWKSRPPTVSNLNNSTFEIRLTNEMFEKRGNESWPRSLPLAHLECLSTVAVPGPQRHTGCCLVLPMLLDDDELLPLGAGIQLVWSGFVDSKQHWVSLPENVLRCALTGEHERCHVSKAAGLRPTDCDAGSDALRC